jgi:ABC-type branched-subunit amino acid transport system substrate-binding protein
VICKGKPGSRTLCAIAVLLLAAGWCGPLVAQDEVRHSDEAEGLFTRALDLYRQEEYRQAVDLFDRILALRPPTHRATAAAIMKAKAFLQLDLNLDAVRTIRDFFSAFPSSSYAADGHYMLGLAYVRVERDDDAIGEFLTALRLAPPTGVPRLEENTRAALDLIIDRDRTAADVRLLLARSVGVRERAFLTLKVAERELAGGNAVEASAMADSLDRAYPGHPWDVRVAAIRGASARRSSVKLGILLPLMRNAEPSAAKQVGNDVYDGIVQAYQEYETNPVRSVTVTLVTLDTERDPVLASRGVRELADDPAVVGIIGPVFSQSTTAAAAVAAARGIPLVSPTANTNGIAAAGPTIFQANPDYENRGKAMARYAARIRKFERVAVLAPGEAHGKAMGEAFIAECLRLNIQVVATEWYARGATDLSSHLQAIRRAAMRAATEPMMSFGGRLNQADLVKLVQAGVPRRRLDSLVERSATIRATALLGPGARRIIDSLGLPFIAATPRADSLEYPVESIDAMYLPISSPEEIGVVTSQLVYFNIQAQILGSGEWNDLRELDANKRYCTGVVFETDSDPDTSEPSLQQFMEATSARLGRPPGKFALYGYDAARLVLGLIGRGAATREALARALSGVGDYPGLHSRVGFAGRRVNPWMFLMQYTGEGVRRVSEIRVDAVEP